jgi:alkyldihydroxyacetonephosphate synthase
MGYAIDTLETATSWARISAMVERIEVALRTGLEDVGERVHVFTHLSHLYPCGSSIYTTYLYRLAPDPEENQRRWEVLKSAASQVIVAEGGTISHQHGVGTDHLGYLAQEKGGLGMDMIRVLSGCLDPEGIMNPGKLMD